MTRVQLRKLLTDKVKLKYDFFIVTCDHEKASINIKIPQYIRDNSGSIYDYDLNNFSEKDKLKHIETIELIKYIMENCCKKLEKHNFKILERNDFNIVFMFPEQYKTKKKLLYDDVCGMLENYIPIPNKFLENN